MAATLKPSAITGKNITFTASEACFLPGDVGRQIIFGASRAIIITFGASAGSPSPNAIVKADIIDDFPNTEPIPAHDWLLRLSPQSTLNPDKKGPVGTKITLVADKDTFRAADLGKYIIIYGGVVEIQGVTSATTVVGEILNVLITEEDDPPGAIGGNWTLEVSSWSIENGFPRTGEFVAGRLTQASTSAQPTNFWMSAPDNYSNYAVGTRKNDAIDHTIAARKMNRIEWIVENDTSMYLGGTDVEMEAKSGRYQESFGGDVVPDVHNIGTEGSAPVQAVVVNNKIIFIDRSRLRIFTLSYNIDDDKVIPVELTAIADHITGTGLRLGPIAHQKRLDHRFYFVRKDGILLSYTYFPTEKVTGFTRIITDGLFKAVGCISGQVGKQDEVWVIVERTIDGVTKQYVEVFEDYLEGMTRPWSSLQTDCAFVYTGVPTLTITGVPYLEGKTIDIILNGSYIGQKLVTDGTVTFEVGEVDLTAESMQCEGGLHYDSTITTLRPTVEGTVIDGLPRLWSRLGVRLLNSKGGILNDERLVYPTEFLDTQTLYTGDLQVTPQGISGSDADGRITIKQTEPYPMTVLMLFGTLQVGDHD